MPLTETALKVAEIASEAAEAADIVDVTEISRRLVAERLNEISRGNDAEWFNSLKGAEVTARLRNINSWIGEINPNFDPFDIDSPYCNNCGCCALSIYSRLEGIGKICATDINIPRDPQMEAIIGKKFIPMTPEAIEQYMLDRGTGAHEIIGINRYSGPGHWFNVANIDGRVVAIDGQDGSIRGWPPEHYGDIAEWEISVRV